jgi:4,5-dihydroxyphthalate decarboxylase
MTANVWVRGMFQDEYGVKPSDIKWRNGGLEEAGRAERTKITLPAEIELQAIPKDRTLNDMLAKGEIDALLSARAPSCFLAGDPNVARMFPNYPEVEEAYFKKTGLFPIMHAIGIRKTLVEKHPWLAVSVYKAFLEAKRICMDEMGQIGHLHVTQPWSVFEYERLKRVMGEDYWAYGAHENKLPLETLMRYSFEQGLAPRKIPLDEMFAKSIYELSKV